MVTNEIKDTEGRVILEIDFALPDLLSPLMAAPSVI